MSDIVNENVIEFLRNQDTATVTFCQPRFVNKVKALAKHYPEEVKITAENEDGSLVAHIPTRWICLKAPRQMTEEERQILSDRARKNFGRVTDDCIHEEN